MTRTMTTTNVGLLLMVGAILAVGMVLLRVRSGNKYDVKTTDLVWLVVPLFLFGIATGKIKGLDFFGVKADLSEMWNAAGETKIKQQIVPTTLEDVVRRGERATKEGINEVERLKMRNVETLEFRLDQGQYYYGPAIKSYFDALSGTSYLHTVVVNNRDGTLFGVYNARNLLKYLRTAGDEGYMRFQNYLNRSDVAARADLAKLPGFVSVGNAVKASTTKRDALARMENLNKDNLPVIDERGRFVGTVERARLTSSLILAVTEMMESPQASKASLP